MSVPIPPIPTSPTRSPGNWVAPLALGSFWLCLLVTLYFLAQALMAAAVSRTDAWLSLMVLAWEHQIDGSLWWLLRHPVAASLIAALLCLTSTVASWGLWRERRWGLWSYVWALILTAAANFVIAWWLDRLLLQLIALLADNPDLQHDLQVQRVVFTLMLVGTSVLFAGMQGWLAWRLLRPDIRARFR